MAAAISGLPTTRIAFDGFLPRSGAARRERLTEIARERRTTVLYEAPHRLERTLEDLASTCDPTRTIVLARELTKLHEDLWRGTLEDALLHVRATEPRGEYAIVIAPHQTDVLEITDTDIIEELTQRIQSGLTTRDAINEVTDALGVPRKRVYTLAVAL
jgi:16S rRNA (cytidine1402-2'-O)-methyltransferase